jgi:hypothetical protein
VVIVFERRSRKPKRRPEKGWQTSEQHAERKWRK